MNNTINVNENVQIDIDLLLKQLPNNYHETCKTEKAIQRNTNSIKSEDDLLRSVFYYVSGHTMLEAAAYIQAVTNSHMSDPGFSKKFRACGNWIKRLLSDVSVDNKKIYSIGSKLDNRRVLAVDASNVSWAGSASARYSLHYAFDIVSMSSAIWSVTKQSVGESLTNFEFQKGDIVFGDRAYGTITGIEHCLKCSCDFILRLKNKSFKLFTADNKEIKLHKLLDEVGQDCKEFLVYYKNSDSQLCPLRLCAVKKTAEQQEYERKRDQRFESKKQYKLSKETKYTHNYFFVVTSLGEEFSCEEIMSLYRLRWQVEIAFKRLKSLLEFGALPTRTGDSCETWLNAKMLFAVLIEKIDDMVFFSQ